MYSRNWPNKQMTLTCDATFLSNERKETMQHRMRVIKSPRLDAEENAAKEMPEEPAGRPLGELLALLNGTLLADDDGLNHAVEQREKTDGTNKE
jgi:hypothetical protein